MTTAEILGVAKRVRRVFVRAHGDDRLAGQCHEASQRIARRLRAHGAVAVLVTGRFDSPSPLANWHAWIEVDGLILDATASQFDAALPEVWFPADATRYTPWARCVSL